MELRPLAMTIMGQNLDGWSSIRCVSFICSILLEKYHVLKIVLFANADTEVWVPGHSDDCPRDYTQPGGIPYVAAREGDVH